MARAGIIPLILPVHVAAGLLALAFGYVALYAVKGAALHRRSGLLFVYAMLAMALTAVFMEAVSARRITVNVVAGLVTLYFVVTSLLTVRPRLQRSQRIDAIAPLFGLMVALLAFKAAFEMAKTGRPETAPCVIFGVLTLLGATGDIRMIRGGGLQGRRRIARHLWRMCFAMWIAAASFFWGPPRRVPELIRIPALQAVAVLLPIAVMLFWLWRLRRRHALAGIPGVVSSQVTRSL